MFTNGEGPTPSSIAKQFLECGCQLVRAAYSYELSINTYTYNYIHTVTCIHINTYPRLCLCARVKYTRRYYS